MRPRRHGIRPTVWLWTGAGLLLLVPFFAMQVTDEVSWTAFDFVAAALLLGAVCGGIECAARARRGPPHLVAAAVALLGGLMVAWANLAVGFVGNEGNPLNLMFFAALALGLVLAALARFRPPGMARAMAATAAALGGAAAASVVLTGDIGAIYAAAMAAPFLLSAWLFRRVA